MSDDASPSSPARIAGSSVEPFVESSVEPSGSRVAWDASSELATPSRRRAQSQSQRRKKKKSRRKRNPGLARKLEFVTHLLKSLDTLVFVELSALYYMECSMFRFVLRAVGQYMYLTPKDDSFPFLMPATRMHVMLVVIPNIICMLLHLFCSLSVGPDYHRGYMHGGLVIDFIGQKPPTSRLYYLLADVAILAIQCLMLTVHTERERLRVMLKTFRPLVSDLAQQVMTIPSIEDLDAEERGVSRDMSGFATTDETNDVEMQPLRRASDADDGNEQNGESESLSRESSMEESSRSHLSDVLSSGNAILGEYHVIHSIRSAAMDLERTAASSLRSLSYGATLAALEARRRGGNVTSRPVQTDRQQ
ncbi:hypothetical protein BGZ61DRAFT_525168 [Ilyonectria robusta]|uniref:uncharacterized protein n=1 Tax=Ilyonectria robusta TaxID=1079257 RepID=UPI001E8E9C15|nr:uncharacterized protein BGZ61DRAFT_525168 [Ilyonectria robusta]KAH8736956.1 hypothetical protein BGZ61DRAFT_525168 [Ilyonectria robusta]